MFIVSNNPSTYPTDLSFSNNFGWQISASEQALQRLPYTGGGVCPLAKSSRTWAITASVCALRPSENATGTRWRVCIYHSAPSAMVCSVISSKHSACAQSWISSNGSGLGLPRLYSTGFRRPV